MKRLLLTITGVFAVTICGVVVYSIGATHRNPAVPTAAVVAPPNTSGVFNLVNAQRKLQNEAPLVDNPSLDKAASAKCADMVAKNYWSHVAPDGTQPWAFIKAQNVSYKAAGENLEYGTGDSAGVITRWLASPGHRANMLNADYNYVGTAVCHSATYQGKTDQYVVVQEFIYAP